MQSVITNSVEEAWKGSYIAINEIIDNSARLGMPFTDNITNMVIVVAIVVMFLFSFSQIIEGIFAVSLSTFNAKRLIAIEQQANLYASRNMLLLFSLVISVFIFVNHNATKELLDNNYPLGIRFITILLSLLGYFAIRYLIFKTLDWVNGKHVFKYVNRFYYTHAIMGILLLSAGFIIYMVLPEISQVVITIYAITAFSFTIILYIIRSCQIIISNGFSHFFWILYLCTLEILPLLAILHLIIS